MKHEGNGPLQELKRKRESFIYRDQRSRFARKRKANSFSPEAKKRKSGTFLPVGRRKKNSFFQAIGKEEISKRDLFENEQAEHSKKVQEERGEG